MSVDTWWEELTKEEKIEFLKPICEEIRKNIMWKIAVERDNNIFFTGMTAC